MNSIVKIFPFFFLFLIVSSTALVGQEKKQAKTPKRSILEVKALVVNESDKPIVYADIFAGESAAKATTDINGEFTLKIAENSFLEVNVIGYESQVIMVTQESIPSKIVLKTSTLLTDAPSLLNRADGSSVLKRYSVSASTKMEGNKLVTYPDLVVSNALQGKMAGLIVRNNVSGLGNNSPDLFIRGMHTLGGSEAVVVVDGIIRPLEDLIAEEIESVELLNDAPSKALFGAKGANGVLWVTTRRGQANRRTLSVSAEYGSSEATRMPSYLNSYEYAKLFNEARDNDGLVPYYSADDLNGYANSKGAHDLLYPNANYQQEFLNSQTTFQKYVVDLNGGTDKVRYSLVLGFTNSDGLEKAANSTDLNRFNLRGNLDAKLNDMVSFVAGVSARMEARKWGALDGGQLFSAISTMRSNEYPFTIAPTDINLPPDTIKGLPYFGASKRYTNSLYADMAYGGNTAERYTNNQTNLGLVFDLKNILDGLSANLYYTFDNYDYYKESQTNKYATWEVKTYYDNAGILDTLYTQLQKYEPETRKKRDATSVLRTSGYRGNLDYQKRFGEQGVNATMAYQYSKVEVTGGEQDPINNHLSLRMGYDFKQTYFAEFTGVAMGSNRYSDDNQYFMSPSVGASWLVSNESFMKNLNAINFLKLKASYGILGFDNNTDFLLHEKAWAEGKTSINFGEANGSSKLVTTNFIREANNDLEWEQSAEFNVGIDGLFFNTRLRAEFNYFNEKRTNIVSSVGSTYNNTVGNYVYSDNIGSVANQGVEGYLNWNQKIGEFSYTVGGNFIYSKSEILAVDEGPGIEDYRSRIGKSVDAIFGYEALGLFGKDVVLAGHPLQAFSPKNGDIAYQNMNSDNVIDKRDETQIGNDFPTTTFGVDINLQYKGWGLVAYGYAELGVYSKTENSYYWNRGEDKYSSITSDRYHPVNNPSGNYPSLTTTTGENNFTTSSFWIQKTDFFRLKNVELSYTFNNLPSGFGANRIKLFARGTNLFVISDVEDLDPELLNGGVTNYPLMSTYTGGVSITF